MNLKRIFIVASMLIMSMFVFLGCNKEENIEAVVNNYAKLLNDGKYEELYEELANESKKYIDEEYESKEGFVQKYSNIYSAMGVNNIKIDIKDSENKLEIPITITMNTIAGELKFDDANIKLAKEDNKYKILWNESLILPQMIQGDKIRVKTTNGSRGRILDRNDNLLAYNGEVNFVNIVPDAFEENKNENISKMADILDISEEYIEDKLNKSTNSDEALFIVKVSNYEQEKVEILSDINGVSVQKGISRVYAQGEAFGSLLGYIGSITEEELAKNPNKEEMNK